MSFIFKNSNEIFYSERFTIYPPINNTNYNNTSKNFKSKSNLSSFIYKKKFPPTNYKSCTFYKNKFFKGNEFNNNTTNKNGIINNNEIPQIIKDCGHRKYIIETVKVEVFCKPENLIYYNHLNNMGFMNQKYTKNIIDIWKRENCCSSTESLICLGN